MTSSLLKTKRAAVAAILVATACGTATGPATRPENPGTGTGTLRVVAFVDANADPASGVFSTDYVVNVRNGANFPVSGATVTLTNRSFSGGKITLVESTPGSGIYQLIAASGFPSGDFRLDIVQGANTVSGASVDGPRLHNITTPAKNATVPAGQPLMVRWSVPVRAEGARLDTRNFGPVSFPDTGSYQIPGGPVANPARPDQRVRVFRFNEVNVAGGQPGSLLRVTVGKTVEPVVVQ